MMAGSPFAGRTQGQFLQQEMSLNGHRRKTEDDLCLSRVSLVTMLKQENSLIGQSRPKAPLCGQIRSPIQSRSQIQATLGTNLVKLIAKISRLG
jgi:hypothetical protein